MPNEHRADPTPPPHHGQGRGGSKKESSSLRVSPALHPPERPSPRRADIADHGLGRETRERKNTYINLHAGTPKPQSFLSKSSGLQCSNMVLYDLREFKVKLN